MLTLLIVVMFAKFGHSTHLQTQHNHGYELLETLFGQEHLRITEEKHNPTCNPSWRQLQADVMCKPRERIIPLGNEFIPNAIKIQRCSGMCELLNGACPEGCHALERRNVTIKAYKLDKKKKTCVSITIEEDTHCGCKSKTMFNIQDGKFWDKKSCKFVCLKKPCTTGTVLDHDSCRCVMKRNVH